MPATTGTYSCIVNAGASVVNISSVSAQVAGQPTWAATGDAMTFPQNVISGHTIISYLLGDSTGYTLSGGGVGTWHAFGSIDAQSGQAFYGTSSGGSKAVVVTDTDSFWTGFSFEVSGITGGPVAVNNNSGFGVDSLSVTPTAAGQFVVVGIMSSSLGTGPGAPWIEIPQPQFINDIQLYYLVSTGTSAVTATWTSSGNASMWGAAFPASSPVVSPINYTVNDITGASVAVGSGSALGLTIAAPGGSWPAGWSLAQFLINGVAIDSCQITAFRSGIGSFPPVPAFGTSPAASDITNAGFDCYLHGYLAGGPQRYQINDSSNPTVVDYPPGPQLATGSTIADIQPNIALDQGAAGWLNPTYKDSARPHHSFIQFPNGLSTDSGYNTGVGAVVSALGPGTSYNVTYFEGLNEPSEGAEAPIGGAPALSQVDSATQFNNFRAALRAANASVKAMGSCEVQYAHTGSNFGNPNNTDLATWLSHITAGTLDAFSVHDYNAYNGDFFAFDGWLSETWATLAAAGYAFGSIPFFLTETGNVISNWGCFSPTHLVQWHALLYMTAERWAIPKENIYIFFDTNNGADDGTGTFGSFYKEAPDYASGDLRPQAVYMRVRSEELWGKTYASALAMGTVGSSYYRGNLYTGSGGNCIELLAQGAVTDTITLNISTTGTITYSDWQGQTHTVTASAGKINLPIGPTPIYVRLNSGDTPTMADVGNGLGSSPTNLATSATATSGSGASNIAKVNNGTFETDGYLFGPDMAFKSGTLPDTVTLTWGSAQTMNKVLIRQIPPWVNVGPESAIVTATLKYWNGSAFVACPTIAANHWDSSGNYNNTTAVSAPGLVGQHAYYTTNYDNHWVHNIDLSSPVTTTKLQLTVTATSYGQLPDAAALANAPFGLSITPQFKISEMEVFNTGTGTNFTQTLTASVAFRDNLGVRKGAFPGSFRRLTRLGSG